MNAHQHPTEEKPVSAAVLRMRRHREALQLALRDRLTLDQARERLDSYREHLPRLKAETISCFALPPAPTIAATPAETAEAEEEGEQPRMWWQRD